MWGKTGAKLYGEKSGRDFSDNQRRFLLFSKAALAALHSLPFSPGTAAVVVCNDWHTAILPVLLKVGGLSLACIARMHKQSCDNCSFDCVSHRVSTLTAPRDAGGVTSCSSLMRRVPMLSVVAPV